MRRMIRPTAPAASRKSARPPRMINGSGNDVAPPGELFLSAIGIAPAGGLLPGSDDGVVVVVRFFVPDEVVVVCEGVVGFFLWAIASRSARSMSSRALE